MADEMKDVMITLKDNPWNYFENFEQWYEYDSTYSPFPPYTTLGLLASVSDYSSELSEEDIEESIDEAIYKVFELFDPNHEIFTLQTPDGKKKDPAVTVYPN